MKNRIKFILACISYSIMFIPMIIYSILEECDLLEENQDYYLMSLVLLFLLIGTIFLLSTKNGKEYDSLNKIEKSLLETINENKKNIKVNRTN